jgi:lipoyl(octanoyl) transferase
MTNPMFSLLQQSDWWCVQFNPSQSYQTIYTLQKTLQPLVSQGKLPNIVLMGHHPETVTLGKKTEAHHIKTIPPHIPTVHIERGGSITYHYPQQIVVYPILKLKSPNVHQVARWLEQSWIETLETTAPTPQGLQSIPTQAGIWTTHPQPQKIAALGLAVKQWVTYHGIAINLGGDTTPFTSWMHPCGLPENTIITSVDSYYKHQHPIKTVAQASTAWLNYLAQNTRSSPSQTLNYSALQAQLSHIT